MADDNVQSADECLQKISDMSVNEFSAEKESAINGTFEDDDIVTPWNVECQSETGVDYDKLISKFFL